MIYPGPYFRTRLWIYRATFGLMAVAYAIAITPLCIVFDGTIDLPKAIIRMVWSGDESKFWE